MSVVSLVRSLADGWGGRHPMGLPVSVVPDPEEWVYQGCPFTFVTSGVEGAVEGARFFGGHLGAFQVTPAAPSERMPLARESRASRPTTRPSSRASLAPALPPSSTTIASSAPSSRSVLRAWAATSGSRSQKILLSQAAFSQNIRRLRVGGVRSPPHLSLVAAHRRGWGSLYAALSQGIVGEEALRNLLARYPLAESVNEAKPQVYLEPTNARSLLRWDASVVK